jgi:hypothetical protein
MGGEFIQATRLQDDTDMIQSMSVVEVPKSWPHLTGPHAVFGSGVRGVSYATGIACCPKYGNVEHDTVRGAPRRVSGDFAQDRNSRVPF